MSRRKKGLVPEDDEPELDISSLIDVCFLLLIYFMVTATIQPRESDLGMTLPSSQTTDTPPDLKPMLIDIKDDGSIVVNKDEPLDLAASGPKRNLPLLEQRLQIYKDGASAANEEPLVQVAVRDEASQQAVIDVLNCLVGLEIQKVTFTDFSNK